MIKSRLLFALALTVLAASFAIAQEAPTSGPDYVSEPFVPTLTPAVKDLPDFKPDKNLIGQEMKRRDDFGFIPILYPIEPKTDSLLSKEASAPLPSPDGFSTPIHNYSGQTSSSSPPDCTGDVGPTYFLQAVNQSVSTVEVINKNTGANTKTFTMQSLTTASPCNSGFCDPVVLYDRMANRWLISELPSSGGNVCVYVSTSSDPTGTWYAYTFAIESSLPDYPKYGVWPQNGNGGSYLIGVNAGSSGYHDLFALDRAKMLSGQPASFQKFSVPDLANSGFQLVLPSTVQGPNAPPNGEPAIFIRPHDDEAEDGANTPTYDWLDIWALTVDWATPANSALTKLPNIQISDYDMTLCGMGNTWNCMPQPGTTQKIDPIREPLHFPLQYRNFGDHQTLVGCFVEDVDGTDHAALRWFEVRKTGAGSWMLNQEGVVGGEANVHRSVGSIAMDGSGNIALGYTRTGTSSPYYPSIYYKGRLSSDGSGTMPQGEYTIVDATTSKTGNERWGDYAGMAMDPTDDCTFWFTTEYGGSGNTKVAAFKFDACGCAAVPAAPNASASVPQDNRIDVTWNDSATPSVTQYLVSRSLVHGGPYTQIAAVSDTSPGTGGGSGYTYHDDTVSGGTTYYYVIRSTDGAACTSAASAEVSATATGKCLLAPTFAGVSLVANPGAATCSLDVSWLAGTAACNGPVRYNVYRSTSSGFTPSAANRVAINLNGTAYADAGGLANGTTYYYVVRAVDSSNGVEDTNTAQASGIPSGPVSTSTMTDTFEGTLSGGGFDLAGWTHSALSGTVNWAWSTAQHHDGTHSWFSASQTTASDRVLVSPAFGVVSSTVLTFYHTYAFEGSTSTCYDGGTLEISTDGGSTWSVVPDSAFTAGGFTGTVNTSYSNPIGGKRAWCAGTVGTMTQVSVNLGSLYVGQQNCKIRWHEGDDSSTKVTGWYVDTVIINNAGTAGACASSSASPPGVQNGMTGTAMKGSKLSADGTNLHVTWDNSCTGTQYGIVYGTSGSLPATYSGTYTPAGGATIGTSGAFDWYSSPSVPASGYLWWLVVATDGSGTEGAWGKNSGNVERTGPGTNGASGICGTNKSLSNTCGQ